MPKENPVIAFLNKMADLILLNLIFLLCCIPVVTIGPAITALYAVSLRSLWRWVCYTDFFPIV
jgi:hypothetical protein